MFAIGESIAIEYNAHLEVILNKKSFSETLNLSSPEIIELLKGRKAKWSRKVARSYIQKHNLQSEIPFLKLIYVIKSAPRKHYVIQEIPKGQNGNSIVMISNVSHLSLQDDNVSLAQLHSGKHHQNINRQLGEVFSSVSELSKIERDILELSCSGLRPTEMAEEINRSVETVKTYKKKIIRKLGARNLFEAITIYKTL